MTSLSIEMGLSRRRTDEARVPDHLANRNDMTLAQKQRLAVMAKMGVGPEAAGPALTTQPQLADLPPGPASRDRRAELREMERKQRQEAGEDDGGAVFEQQIKKPRPKMLAGLSRLGPVQPREGGPQVPVVPAQVPEPKQWTLKISKDTAELVGKTSEAAKPAPAAEAPEEDSSDDDEEVAKQQQERDKQKERDKRAAAAKQERERQDKQRQQAKKRKRNKKGKDEDAADDWQDESEEEDEADFAQAEPRRPSLRDGGAPKQMMVVESVKGKVSNANKNLTDADLERRFSLFGGGDDSGSLMSEEQVLRMIRREKQERGGGQDRGGASASRRVQRELDEWADKKAQQRARVKSPHRFERMVIARK
eukprot:TRINITY_DN72186_c0_g1_i1.p1 TRINITY_DN72186_c0_g1~~TRINITY_DN72186_c0_g1_i1.p1  ORF type:complete len:365 (-),score=116.07 TRINITY_DN72186_c0_g1_i1:108-1202(-)